MAWLGFVLTAILVASWSSPSEAQSPVAYRDGDGRWQWTESGDQQAITRKGAASLETIGGTFTVTFEDVDRETGVGFDSPASGASRRETFRTVLLYLSSVLDVVGTADLVVLASQTDGTGPLASAGPYLLPIIGFQGGLVYEHLMTGVDPLADTPDGTVSVDFGFPWNSETDPTSDVEFDLYTALLHEVTHALGFLSIVGPDATSALLNVNGAGLFSAIRCVSPGESMDRYLFLEGGEINSVPMTSRAATWFSLVLVARFVWWVPGCVCAEPVPRRKQHWTLVAGDEHSAAVMSPIVEPGDERRDLHRVGAPSLGRPRLRRRRLRRRVHRRGRRVRRCEVPTKKTDAIRPAASCRPRNPSPTLTRAGANPPAGSRAADAVPEPCPSRSRARAVAAPSRPGRALRCGGSRCDGRRRGAHSAKSRRGNEPPCHGSRCSPPEAATCSVPRVGGVSLTLVLLLLAVLRRPAVNRPSRG